MRNAQGQIKFNSSSRITFKLETFSSFAITKCDSNIISLTVVRIFLVLYFFEKNAVRNRPTYIACEECNAISFEKSVAKDFSLNIAKGRRYLNPFATPKHKTIIKTGNFFLSANATSK